MRRPRRQMQRCVAVLVDLGGVRVCVAQQLRDLFLAIFGGEVQGRAALLGQLVDLHPALQQKAHDTGVPGNHGCVQGREGVVIGLVPISERVAQEPHHVQMTFPGGGVQWRLPVGRVREVGARRSSQGALHCLRVTVPGALQQALPDFRVVGDQSEPHLRGMPQPADGVAILRKVGAPAAQTLHERADADQLEDAPFHIDDGGVSAQAQAQRTVMLQRPDDPEVCLRRKLARRRRHTSGPRRDQCHRQGNAPKPPHPLGVRAGRWGH
mmetsp:Transcript_90127/g.232640  ORF Transcript_90127/g.232640 Transcript_90127/m.232640 type:complete len:267 (+) Transcript_90127:1251-2051(+)